MSNEEHTPGPWHSNGTAVWSGEKMVAAVYGDDPDCKPDGRMKANARLIAAAPKLLAFVSEYLEAWADGMAGDSYLRRQAEALLGEATGEQPK